MKPAAADWQPSASLANLRLRARLLARTRQFFAHRNVLEVDTPAMVNTPVSDLHIHSARVSLTGAANVPLYLHTSPEYAMKRLLACGSGDVYQVCHVVRGFESGRLHNPEFTLVEWYRLGITLEQLMDEVEELVRELLDARAGPLRSERISYREAFVRELHLDPLETATAALAAAARDCGLQQPAAAGTAGGTDRDTLLEFLMATRVGPRLGAGALTFVHGYPASQAALARLDPRDPRTARRFELYCAGVELANGFHELAAAAEQRQRFEQDNRARVERGQPVAPLDERLLAALDHGLPDCAGVALGFDRVAMLAAGAARIDEVLSFTTARA
ncbi:MAG: EF-P lysine aminoacylase GenX [Proteobacteria bacterium]|nr:EF-P lysine aminoacylase GenX [Pseudomonadota bacterium]